MLRSRVEDEVLTVKLLAELALPPSVVTENLPVVAPFGTVVVIWVAVFAVIVAEVPFKLKPVALLKLVPLITTGVPTGPAVGLNPVIVGAETVTTKLVAEVAVPPGVVTENGPPVAPLGTVAVICVALSTA
jgi:hypothetical protein